VESNVGRDTYKILQVSLSEETKGSIIILSSPVLLSMGEGMK